MSPRMLRQRRAKQDADELRQLRQRIAELEARLDGTSAANAGNV